MTEAAGAQKNTAYGVFVQACWAQHKRQYPDELIHKEIEEFNKQCSVWWYNLSEQERDRFQVRLAVKISAAPKLKILAPIKNISSPTKNKCTHVCVSLGDGGPVERPASSEPVHRADDSAGQQPGPADGRH